MLETTPYDLDDALITRAQGDNMSLVRVYRWTGTAVVIGRGGDQSRELNLAALAEDDVLLYKRPGGGCAVVLDPGNVIVSLAWPLPGLGGIKAAFGRISQWLIDSLATCGVPDVQQRGVSDLAVGDQKIGGSCIWRTRGLLYYSTTLLVDPDISLVERYLPRPPREPDYRKGRPHKAFMGSLAEHCGHDDPARLTVQLQPELAARLSDLTKDIPR